MTACLCGGDTYQETAVVVIQRYAGYIAQYLGDGLLVYFGWPLAHENDAQRAVHAGLGIIEAMGTLNTRLGQVKGIRLAVRLGIHVGPVVIGEMGSGERHEQLALGETPNIAARLEGMAQPNTVVISDTTLRLVEGYFTCDNLGSHTLKGMATPMQVYGVQGRSGAHTRLDAVAHRGLTPLVGREQEVGILLERWQQVQDGLGQVVLLSGEAGLGKSRLVQVLQDQVGHEPHARLACRSSPYYQNTALYPLTDLWQHTLQWHPNDTPETKVTKLEHTLSQYRLPLADTMPLMAALLSLPLPERRYAALQMTPQRQRQQTLEALRAMVFELAERQPVLLIVEDLHWTDPSTLEWLGMLIEQAPTAALMLLQAVSSLDTLDVWRSLVELVEAELLYQRGSLPDATFTFKHALIQETAYQSLLKSTRQQYHERIAQTLAERFPETVATRPELLAHHYTEAGLTDQAVSSWQQAGEQAVERSAHEEAIGHLNKALVLLPALAESPACLQRELDILLALRTALGAARGHAPPEVTAVLARVRALCQQIEESPRLLRTLLSLGFFHLARAELQTTLELLDQCLALAERLHDPVGLQQTYYQRGGTLLFQGELQHARDDFEQVIALYDPHQHHHVHIASYGREAGVSCRFFGALTLWFLGYPAQALARLREALGVVDKAGLRKEVAEIYRLKGELLLQLSSDHHAAAETCFQQALEISRHQQAKSWELRAATSLARLWQQQDKRQDAYDLLAPVYGWFTEGFDTSDLKDAKALLDDLS